MSFEIPREAFKNDTIYHQFGMDYHNIFGCGFLNKKNRSCTEDNNVFYHYGAVLVLSGKGVHVDEDGKETNVYPGCLIQRIPEKRQSLFIEPDGSWLEFFICIGKNMYDSLLSMDLLDTKQNVLFPGISRAIFEYFQEFLDFMKHAHPSEINLLLPETLKIILMLHNLHKENSSSSIDREIIRKACLILSKPSAYEQSIPELAKDLGVGYEKFRKVFKEQMGISPGSYIMQRRMDTAKTCLIEKSKSIKEIALELGFSDAYAFSKQFRQHVGIAPNAFRKMY